MLMQVAAFNTPFQWNEDLNESPGPLMYWLCSIVMFLLTMIEKYTFAFHPLQKNIFHD